MAKIIAVCLGNICRSPLAHGLLSQKLGSEYEIASAGTGGWHIGQSPDPRSMEIAQKNGLDISHQKGRQLKSSDLDYYDYILVMDLNNFQEVHSLAKNDEQRNKIELILNYAFPGENMEVPDPYYGGIHEFQSTFDLLDKATDAFIKTIQ